MNLTINFETPQAHKLLETELVGVYFGIADDAGRTASGLSVLQRLGEATIPLILE